jgi:quinol monooxygenase YgiN
MSTIKVVRYRTKPEHADENVELVRAVFAELATEDPGGLRYATLRLEDGVTFVHIATIEGATNPLAASAAFQRFQSAIAERCEEGPIAMDASVVGEYSLPIG